jgi:hypothetical protein
MLISGFGMPVRVLALLFTFPLAASGLAGIALHVCQSMGGIAAGDCGCETQMAHEGHDGHGAHAHDAAAAALRTQPCCSVELTDATTFVATREVATSSIDDAPITFVGFARAALPKSRLECDESLLRERAPPNLHPPPLYLSHCSFLN